MITLMTGVPGTGKTAHIVAQMVKEKSRPFFVMGIPDLTVPHCAVPPVDDWTELRPDPDDPSVLLPYFTFPPNSIVIVDEAQRIYRPRASGSKVPSIVAAFETHRHTGVDFWLITQGPALIDSNIRRLVTKHWHIHPTPFGRKLLEWSQCRDPDSKSDRADALKSKFSPPRSVFGLYKSAEVHTVVSRSIPKSFVVVVASVVVASALGWYAYGRIKTRVTKPDSSLVVGSTQPIGVPSPPGLKPDNLAVSPSGYLDRFTPVHPNFPESAPAYDAVRLVKAMPIVAGCIKTASFCRCYSQQSTVLDIQPDRCASIVANKVFDPYRADPVQVAARSDVIQIAQAGGGASDGAKVIPSAVQPVQSPSSVSPLPSRIK